MRGAPTNALPRPSWGPLALTVGLHLLLVLACWTGLGRAPVRKSVQERVQERASLFVAVAPLPASRRADASPPITEPSPPRTRRVLPSAASLRSHAPEGPRDREPPDLPAPVTAAAAPVAPPAASTPDAVTGSPPAAPAPDATRVEPGLPGDLLASSKRMAGRVDRELRNGASPITAEPDRKWARFAEAVAGAHVGGGNTVTLSSYTAPDGVVIYRKTVGNRTRCYRSGSVGGVVGGFGPADGQGAGTIPCPSGADWQRH